MNKAPAPLRSLHVIQDDQNFQEVDRVAFATKDRMHVDQHFGSSKCFLIFRCHNSHWHLIEAVEFEETQQRHDVNKLEHRISKLLGCSTVYCNAIGHSAIKILLQKNIKPQVVEPMDPIEQLLSLRLKELEAGSATRKSPENRITDLESLLDEQWTDETF